SFRLSPPSVPTTAPHKTPPAPAPKATTATSAPPRPTTKSFTLPDPAVYFPGDMEVRADWQQDGILDDLPEEKVEGVGTYRMAYAVYAPFDLPPGQSDLSVEVRIFTGAPAVISALYNTKSDALPSAAQPSPFSGHWLVERLDTGGKSFWITTGSVLINVSGTPEQEAINILKLVRSKVISGEPT
ncbi:MAG: hypothetical protein KKB70_11510, partial [Proteobacteria bacterium]|nr:hypothetical protein [Pseudomonadota bacterium]